jgi:hypothetical protein
MAKKGEKIRIKIDREKLRPRERAPIKPSRKFEEKTRREERQPKHKKNPLRSVEEE